MTIRAQLVAARAEEFLTVKEYARIARACTQTIYRRIWAGQQPGAVRMGGQWRIDLAAATTSRPRDGRPGLPESIDPKVAGV